MADQHPESVEASGRAAPADEVDEVEEVRRPSELWRIEGALGAVRYEVDQLSGLDDGLMRARLASLERRWRRELVSILPEDLVGELHRLLDWVGADGATNTELRLGLAQLQGWLEGLMAGLGIVVVPPPEPEAQPERANRDLRP